MLKHRCLCLLGSLKLIAFQLSQLGLAWIKRKLQTKTKHDIILKSLINFGETTNHFCFLGGSFWICSILTKQKTWYSTACHPWNQLKIYCSTRWCCLQTIIATLACCQTLLQVTNLLQTSGKTSKHGTEIRCISIDIYIVYILKCIQMLPK